MSVKTVKRRAERADVSKRLKGIHFVTPSISEDGAKETFKVVNVSEFGMGLASHFSLLNVPKGKVLEGKILIANTSVPVKAKLVHFTEVKVGFEFVNPPDLVKDAIRLYFESEFIGASLRPVGEESATGIVRYEDAHGNALELKIAPDFQFSRVSFMILGSIAEWNAFGGWRWLQDHQILPVTDYMKKQLIHLTRSAMSLSPSMREQLENIIRNVEQEVPVAPALTEEKPKATEPAPRLLPTFDSLKWVHIIGVGGTLMGSFAAFLAGRKIRVTGSDLNIYPPMSDILMNAGVEVAAGYRAENIVDGSSRPDLIVIGNVIRADNPEAIEAMKGTVPYASLPETMERLLLQDTKNIVVTGTHGKTTTSSMLAHVLNQCAVQPSYFIGGVCPDLSSSFHISPKTTDPVFVLEGDEYDTAFWDKVPKFNHYLPDHVLLTSIEFDHADIYPDLDSIIRVFNGLMTRIRKGGQLIACLDYSCVSNVIQHAKVPVITYGSSLATNAQYVCSDIRSIDGTTVFSILKDGKPVQELSIQLSGRHNVLNAMVVWIECQQLGLDPQLVAAALRSFRGVKRRQEIRGEVDGIIVMDDFAHHPTAVRETMAGLKQRYSSNRLIAVFEPRSATSRRKIFQSQYVQAFYGADVVFVSTPFDQSNIAMQDRFSSSQLVGDLKTAEQQAFEFSNVRTGVQQIVDQSKSGDVIVVFSNGGFGGLIPMLIEQLKAKH